MEMKLEYELTVKFALMLESEYVPGLGKQWNPMKGF